MRLYFEISHSESSRTPAVELFCRNIQRVKVVGYFRRRTPSLMFDRILARRGFEEKLSTPGVTQGNLGPLISNPIGIHQTQK